MQFNIISPWKVMALTGTVFGILSGCAYQVVETSVPVETSFTISVTGYGAMNENKKLTAAQQRLLGMRSSKMDAYRALAERVRGMRLSGSTSVNNMMVKGDVYNAFLESYMRGARVVSISPMGDDAYKTVLELVIDQSFYTCLTTSAIHDPQCSPDSSNQQHYTTVRVEATPEFF